MHMLCYVLDYYVNFYNRKFLKQGKSQINNDVHYTPIHVIITALFT